MTKSAKLLCNSWLCLSVLLFTACSPQKVKPTPIVNNNSNADSTSLQGTSDSIDIGMFPAAKKGYKRIVIQVPEAANENDMKVGISCGLIVDVDLCNQFYLIGKTSEKNLQGWGVTYYEVESDGGYISTKMACQELGTKKQFISLEPIFTRYNSKFPVVLYVPEILSVKYRIWKAGDVFENAESH